MRTLFIILLILFSGTTIAQTTNSYLFIEPNVSLSYDSTTIKIRDRFSNTSYHTESYTLTIIPANADVSIEASIGGEIPTQQVQDSMLELALKIGRSYVDETLEMIGKGIAIHYKDFSGFGFIAKAKKEEMYAISFYCTRFFEGGNCTITYTVTSKTKIENYDNDYKILTSFIDGLRTYTKNDFGVEDSLLRAKYTVIVEPIGRPADLPEFLKPTFIGKVTVIPALENKIKEVSVSWYNSAQLFTPKPDGEIIIHCDDKEKSVIEKKCELILLDKFGKQVRVPFTFKYINK